MNEEEKYKTECQKANKLITALTMVISGLAFTVSGAVLINTLLDEHKYIGIIACSMGVLITIIFTFILIIEIRKRREQ